MPRRWALRPACSARRRRQFAQSSVPRERQRDRRHDRRPQAPLSAQRRGSKALDIYQHRAAIAIAALGRKLEYVRAEGVHGLVPDRDHLPLAALESLQHARSVSRRDRLGTDHDPAGSDREHHVGVINRCTARRMRIEHDRLVIHEPSPFDDQCLVGARRATRKDPTAYVIEHQAAGAFQKAALGLVLRQIQQSSPLEVGLLLHPLDQLDSALRTSIDGQHRIEHNGAVAMPADPACWETRHRAWPSGVSRRQHSHGLRRDGRGRLISSPRLGRRRVDILTGLLKDVARGRLAVIGKPGGSDEQHRLGALLNGHKGDSSRRL